MELVFSIETIIMLAGIAFMAGFIDAIAGGGGLITIPALLLAQMPPVLALATNKFQASFGGFAAATTMVRKGKANLSDMKVSIVMCFVGSVVGTVAVLISPPQFLTVIIPCVIAIICVYFLLAPAQSSAEQKRRVSSSTWHFFCVPGLGFYDGYLGPGAGMFYTLCQVTLQGKNLLMATGGAKVLNFTSNIASLIVFIFSGKVVWIVGGAMAVGQIFGGYLGAHTAIKGGHRVIRPIIVIICLAMLGQYVVENWAVMLEWFAAVLQ